MDILACQSRETTEDGGAKAEMEIVNTTVVIPPLANLYWSNRGVMLVATPLYTPLYPLLLPNHPIAR